MKKRLKILLSFFLVFIIFVSSLCVPASSYENDVETSTADMLLVNLDTNTTVFSQKPGNKWYSGSIAVLMTYLLAYETIEEPESVEFEVKQEFIDELPDTDGCLDMFIDETLTAKDLMAITILSSGSDSAYALAYLSNGSDLSGFVDMMNDRAKELGCKDTIYVSPGFSENSEQHTTCRDVCKLYTAVRKTDIFSEVMSAKKYTPEGFDEEEYTIEPEASMLNPQSPYYFKYTNDAKFSYSEKTYAGIVLTTTYRGMTYMYVGLLGKNESEENVYADARKLITWAYLNLSDRKVINSDEAVAYVNVECGWGNYDLQLYSFNSAYKTLPNEFEDDLLSYDVDVPESVSLPLIKDQKIGKAVISYSDEKIDEVALVVEHDEGVDILNDCARFGKYAFGGLLSVKPKTESADAEEGDDSSKSGSGETKSKD